MTTEEKTLLAALTVAAVFVPVTLGAALGWRAWSWLLLAVVLLGLPGRVAWSIQQRVQRERQTNVTPPSQAEQPEVSRTPVADVALPSAENNYGFRFSATVCWRPASGSTVWHANLDGLAVDAIITRAKAITKTEDPSRVKAVQHRLASELGAVQQDASGGVNAWAEQIELILPEADQARLRKLSDLRKDQDIWERERDHERNKRKYLGEDVLKSTGNAVVWWLAHKDNDVEDTARRIEDLAKLSAVVNGAEVPGLPFESLDSRQPFPNGPFHDRTYEPTRFPGIGSLAEPFPKHRSIASLSGLLMDALHLGDDQRALFAHRIARVVEQTGKPDEAQEIRRRFDTPPANEEPTDIPEPDGERDRPAYDEEAPLLEEPWWNSEPPGESEQGG
jgi:hypothetical protein